jgi:sterol desaturase/sphingolipid hydroxylase (fatty acid hydroxylase superfamily)
MNLEILTSIWLRPTIFIIVLSTLFIIEVMAPRRALTTPKRKRWINNLSLSLINSLAIKFFLPFSLVTIALFAKNKEIGLLNLLELPRLIEIFLILIVFDFFIYLQHVASHKYSYLWRLHKVHHIDLDLDASSGNRFHTLEILLSFLYKIVLIMLIGPSPESIILFEIILNSMTMFNHSNINIALRFDKYLRIFVVTPDMHRIHHSVKETEHNRNFGFNLSLWDFVLKTYKAKPDDGQLNMKIGLNHFRGSKYTSLLAILKIPFISK